MDRRTTWLDRSLFLVQSNASPCPVSLWDCKIIRYRQRTPLVWFSDHFHIPRNTATATNATLHIPNKCIYFLFYFKVKIYKIKSNNVWSVHIFIPVVTENAGLFKIYRMWMYKMFLKINAQSIHNFWTKVLSF